MKFVSLTVIAGVWYCTAAAAAPVDAHLRGTIVSVAADSLVVRTDHGADVSVALNAATHYLQVVPASLDKVDPGSYIGTATKTVGANQIALEVMIFPAALRGINPGHFPYDRLTDTTVSGKTTVTSNMTNGSVATVTTPGTASVDTAMTNGNVAASAAKNGIRQLTVTYTGGQQTILVPPTAPIVDLVPAQSSQIAAGQHVFIDAGQEGNGYTAGLVAAGVNGMTPPF
jgi:uncharacterized lipoprotein NlpE involved in copper resistance